MVDSTAAYERGTDASNLSIMNGERASAERAQRSTVLGLDDVERSGPEHVSALLKMGAAKQDAGDYSDAEDLFRRALELGERVLGPDNPALVAALTNLAGARILCGMPESAEPLVIRALSMTENGLGEYDPDFGILVNDLARLCLKQSAHAVAEPLLLRLLAMKRSKGDDHPEVATVLASLAAVRQALGRHESAEQLWRRVLDIRERTLAPNHFGLATALERLAESCSARGKIGEALGLLQRALTIRELTFGAGNPSLRVSRDRIADLQLQASEDSLDPSMFEVPAPAPEKYRLLAARPQRTSVSRPVQEKSPAKVRIDKAATQPRKATAPIPVAAPVIAAPVIAAPVIAAPVIAAPVIAAAVISTPVIPAAVIAAPVIEAAPAKDEIAPPMPFALEHDTSDYAVSPSPLTVDQYIPDNVAPHTPELVSYRDVILSIQHDLEDDENTSPTAIDRVKALSSTIAATLKQRQKEIAVVAGALWRASGRTDDGFSGLDQVATGVSRSGDNGPSDSGPNDSALRDRGRDSECCSQSVTAQRRRRWRRPEATPVAPSRARVVEQRAPAKKVTDNRDQGDFNSHDVVVCDGGF